MKTLMLLCNVPDGRIEKALEKAAELGCIDFSKGTVKEHSNEQRTTPTLRRGRIVLGGLRVPW